jgi:hypothetical protein
MMRKEEVPMHMNIGDYALSTAIAFERLRADQAFEMADIDGLIDSVGKFLAFYGQKLRENPDLPEIWMLAIDEGLLSAMSSLTGKQGRANYFLDSHVFYGKEL